MFVILIRFCILGYLSYFVNFLLFVFVWEKCDGYILWINRYIDRNIDSYIIINV